MNYACREMIPDAREEATWAQYRSRITCGEGDPPLPDVRVSAVRWSEIRRGVAGSQVNARGPLHHPRLSAGR